MASLFGLAGASGKGGNFVETMIRMGREKGMVDTAIEKLQKELPVPAIVND